MRIGVIGASGNVGSRVVEEGDDFHPAWISPLDSPLGAKRAGLAGNAPKRPTSGSPVGEQVVKPRFSSLRICASAVSHGGSHRSESCTPHPNHAAKLAYELLANELPYVVPPVVASMDGRAASAAKSLAHTRPDLARELCALVDRCLTVEPEARPTAVTLVAALEQVARSERG